MKKLPNQMQSELRQLRDIKPQQVWLESNKQTLLNSLTFAEPTEQKISLPSLASIVLKGSLAKFAWQPVGIALMVLGIVAGPSIAAVNAAKGSLPGDALYPVKRSLERARLSFTFSSTKKAQIEVDLVSNRLHELQRLTKEQAPSVARQQKIAIAIEELKKDTATVKTRLDAAADGDAVALAKIIDGKTADYQQTLNAALDELDPEAAKASAGTLTQAVSTVQDVSLNALDVLVSNGSDKQDSLTQEELEARVKTQFDVVKKAATSLKAQLAAPVATEEQEGEASTEKATSETPAEPEPKDEEDAPSEGPLKADPAPEAESTSVSAPAIVEEPVKEDQPSETGQPATEEPKQEELPPEPTDEEKRAELEKRFTTDVEPLISYAEELINLKDFTAALETLDKVNKQIEEISTTLNGLFGQEVVPAPTQEQPTEPIEGVESESEPKQEASNGETSAPADEQASTETTTETTPLATNETSAQ